MAKKVKAENSAELESILSSDEKEADGEAKELEISRRRSEIAAQKEELHVFDLGKLPNGKPVELTINNKVYTGVVKVPLNTLLYLREQSDKIRDRERDVFVGKKYQGTGTGTRGMRSTGNV